MAGVIEYYYNDVFQAATVYTSKVEKKEFMDRKVLSVGIPNRYKIHFVVRPSLTLREAIEIDKENKKAT